MGLFSIAGSVLFVVRSISSRRCEYRAYLAEFYNTNRVSVCFIDFLRNMFVLGVAVGGRDVDQGLRMMR